MLSNDSSPSTSAAPQEPAPANPAEHDVTAITRHVSTPQDVRPVLAIFRVDPSFRGKEVLRPITYFPIYTEIVIDNNGMIAAPDVPIGAPHLRGVPLGIKRNSWTRGTCAMVERRYGEVQDLRDLLVYQFPNVVIPPLLAKTSVRDLETYFNAGDAIATQRHNLQFFLKEIAAMPELMFFSEWLPPFFLDPRDSFETGTLTAMRAALRNFRDASKLVHQYSQRHRHFAEDAANAIAMGSTRFVRSVANFLWGGAADAAGGDHAPAPASATTSGWASSAQLMSNEEAQQWVKLSALLSDRQQALRQASRAFEAHLVATKEKQVEQLRVAQAIEGYDKVLGECEGFSRLGEAYHRAATAVDEASHKERDAITGKYLNICLRLTFEANYINSVLDAIDHVLCLFHGALTDTYDVRDRTRQEGLEYATAVSAGLRDEYKRRYLRDYHQRMRNLVREKIARPAIQAADAVHMCVHQSALVDVIRDKDFLSRGGQAEQ